MIKFDVRVKTPRLNVLSRDSRARMLAALMLVGESLRSQLARYPGPARRPIAWLHPRQRRAYLARVRDAGERLPYRRSISRLSERLGKSYVVVPRGQRRVTVESKASYSAFVQSARAQQPFHRATGWVTDVQAIARVQRDTGLTRAIRALFR